MSIGAAVALARAEQGGAEVDPYSRRLVCGVADHRRAIDAQIAVRLTGWTLERLAPLERNILRLAVYELKWVEEVPAHVAINEAVELAKRFCSNEAASLVNGVLGAVAEDLAIGGGEGAPE